MEEVLGVEERERVEALLRARIHSAEIVSTRAHVVRVRFGGGDTAIVKRPRQVATGSERVDDMRSLFLAERTGLELLAAMPESPTPTLLAVDDTADLLVMEDLPPGPSIAELLLGDDWNAAEEGVVELARTLASVHGWSAGRESEYQAIRARVGLAVGEAQRWTRITAAGRDAFRSMAEAVGVNVPAVFEEECDEAVARLGAAGWWRGYVHGDPCPDNTRLTAGRLRLFDYEHGNYGSVLLDASYFVAPFPTCWCFGLLPDDLSARALATYRTELAACVPQADDDEAWTEALQAALASWIVARGRVITRVVATDDAWGTTTIRPRVLQWMDSFLTVSASGSAFPALRSVITDLRRAFGDAWPDASPIGYPAFA
ncbi:MAG TPA: phosphotransferase [Acidimicrobiales bacterium]